jgi:demethylmenaquinone methyltransferase/2-methoxy-6-polyprenyl-1,4-benzoquinol methylase
MTGSSSTGDSQEGGRRKRRPGLQRRWEHIVESLESVIPFYEAGSSRIALFGDRQMREDVVRFALPSSASTSETVSLVLDLGSGPGTMARAVERRGGGQPVRLDVSAKMLRVGTGSERVRAVFEHLPFREGAFDAVVAGFSLRDARDLVSTLGQVRYVTKRGGRFAFCDLGKPDSGGRAFLIAFYLKVFVPLIGLSVAGPKGLAFGSLYDTYIVSLKNSLLVALLRGFFSSAYLRERQGGAAIVVECVA